MAASRRVAVVLAGVIGVVIACYAPTELIVQVSSDLACDEQLTAAIYTGEPDEELEDPVAETRTCGPGAQPGADLGSLVVVPSASRDARAVVKIVLARNGKSPAACAESPADCVIATRSFNFEPHRTKRLGIRLYRDCLGRPPCPSGETCDEGGRCVRNEVTCTGQSCTIPGDAPSTPAPPPVDGGVADAAPDGGDPTADVVVPPAPCAAPNGGVKLAGANATLMSASATHLFWSVPAQVAGGGSTIFRLAKATPNVEPLGTLTGPFFAEAALASEGPNAWLGYEVAAGPTFRWQIAQPDGGGVYGSAADRVTAFVVIPPSADTTLPAHYVALESGAITSRAPDGSLMLFTQSVVASRLGVVGTHLLVLERGGAMRSFERTQGDDEWAHVTDPVLVEAAFGPVTVAATNAIAPHALVTVQAATGQIASLLTGLPDVPALAIDGTTVYWTEGRSRIRRYQYSSGGGLALPEDVVSSGEGFTEIEGLAVDTASAGCLYFWSATPGSTTPKALNVVPKTRTVPTP